MKNKKYRYKIPETPNHAANKILAAVPPESKVLEIGCSSGTQTKALKEILACNVTGIEINESAAKEAKKFCENLIIGDIENIDLKKSLDENTFDLVIMSDVLEHLRDPNSVLTKIKPFIKKDHGMVLASIPNIAHASICLELARGRFDYRDFGLLDDTHIRFFTKKTIANLFESSGYHIQKWDRVIKNPQETEFKTQPLNHEESIFLSYIEKVNPEAHTYQFVVTAYPTDYQKKYETDLMSLKETVTHLKCRIEQLEIENKKLLSQVAWIENHRFGRFSPIINYLRRRF